MPVTFADQAFKPTRLFALPLQHGVSRALSTSRTTADARQQKSIVRSSAIAHPIMIGGSEGAIASVPGKPAFPTDIAPVDELEKEKYECQHSTLITYLSLYGTLQCSSDVELRKLHRVAP